MMWYSAAMSLLALAGYYSWRYAWWRRPVDEALPRILMYHMIKRHEGGKFRGLRVSPEMFERQVRYLAERGWTFLTMSELVRRSKSGELPPRSVAITFDDGYEDNFTHALPILEKYDAKATLYLVVDRHDREWSSRRKAKNRDGELKREPKLSDEQVRKMLESGRIELGSHTMTHDNLLLLDREGKRWEIFASKEEIERRFGVVCESFCYPFGLYDEEDVALAKEAGYTSATTTEAGIDDPRTADPYRLRRITVSGKDNFPAFLLKLRTGKRGVRK
jgi:peptidoglycan/xylan/chitin deacetylase (PgdA/CDA1 family)